MSGVVPSRGDSGQALTREIYAAAFADLQFTDGAARAFAIERPVSAGLRRLATRVLFHRWCQGCRVGQEDLREVGRERTLLCRPCRIEEERAFDLLTDSTIHVTPFNEPRTRREEIWMKGRA